jgi:hypothetical protein
MNVKYDDLWGCTDCLMYVANGELPDERPNLARAIAGQWGSDAGNIVCGNAPDDEFSSHECDICGSRLAGARHSFAVLEAI